MVATQADIARREGVTRVRVTQVLMLLRLAPEIQERILNMPKSVDPPCISERGLRPLTGLPFSKQRTAIETMGLTLEQGVEFILAYVTQLDRLLPISLSSDFQQLLECVRLYEIP